MDHKQSHAEGGETEISNLQALCSDCNLKKGSSSEMSLRLWQERALDKYTGTMGRDFLLVATPGAGKTRFAGEVMRNHFRAGAVTRAVIVVPTEHLKVQWARDLHTLGLDIEPYWENSSGSWPTGMHGVAVTYAQVAMNPTLMRLHVSDRATFAALDEIHHCGDQLGWGEAIKQAFEPAVKRLGLSGTPFRSDNNRIPFVRYVDGQGVADFDYGYAEALVDGIVRYVYFPRIGGVTEWSREPGVIERHSFEETLADQKIADRLRTAVSTEGWLQKSVEDANRKLLELRQTDQDAAGFVLAIDYEHASRFVAPLVREVTGREPVLIVSAEPESNERLGRFASGNDPWLIAIRMVSEGVDIPRLRVGVYATTTATELFFRQAVGRLVRIEEEASDAHFYIPDDPRLREWAGRIREERDHVLEQEMESMDELLALGERSTSTFVPLGSTPEDRGVIFDGEEFTPSELDYVNRVKMHDPSTAGLESALLAKFLQIADRHPRPARQATVTAPSELPLFERKKRLAEVINRLVSKLAYDFGIEQKELNTRLNRAIDCPTRKVEVVSLEHLEAALKTIQQWKQDGEVPAW